MATSLRSLRLTIMCVVLVLFLGLVMLRAHLTEKDLRLQEADALRAAVLAELDAHRNELNSVDKRIEEKDNAIVGLDQMVQNLRRELDSARNDLAAAQAAVPPPASIVETQSSPSHNTVPFLEMGPDDAPPPIRESLYARVHGQEVWEKDGLELLSLHNVPTDEWIVNATKVVGTCDLDAKYTYETDEITLVSALLDLGRGTSESGQFIRPMQEYFNRFQRIIDRGFKMMIYMPAEFEPSLKLDPARVKVIHFTVQDLKTYFPYWDRLHAIRKSKLWQAQAAYIGYLKTAPQNRLEGYNPLVMSKILLLRDAAMQNPWKTKYHMWLDAGHFCAYALDPARMVSFTNLFDKMMVTHWPYGTTTEVHGMADKAMHLYVGTQVDPLQIVRGGVFGGTLPYIKCVARLYLHVLATTLTDGYLGTEENILAIAFARFPQLFHGFDNDSLGNHGDNCALFIKNQRDG